MGFTKDGAGVRRRVSTVVGAGALLVALASPAVAAAVVWSPRRIRELPYPTDDWLQCDPEFRPTSFMVGEAINDAGHASGYVATCSGDTNIVYFDGTSSVPLPVNSPGVGASAINATDQIVGWQFPTLGWLYSGGQLTPVDPFATQYVS